MSTSKTNEQAFEALIELALVGTTRKERKCKWVIISKVLTGNVKVV